MKYIIDRVQTFGTKPGDKNERGKYLVFSEDKESDKRMYDTKAEALAALDKLMAGEAEIELDAKGGK